jgi:hypothetical protein
MRKPEITEDMIEAEAERLYYSTRKPGSCFSWRSQTAGRIGFELRDEAKAKLEANGRRRHRYRARLPAVRRPDFVCRM